MHRKGLVIGIIILMLGVNIGSTFAGDVDVKTMSSVSFDGNTLYVGGSGPNNYTTIQSAIDDSVDGDTVFVYDDSSPYVEHIIVNKSIALIGENKNSTTIDGSDDSEVVVQILADGVSVSDFTIQNYGDEAIDVLSNNTVISNNNIGPDLTGYSGYGIRLYHSDGNVISDNFISNTFTGITILYSSDNFISSNHFHSNLYDSIRLQDSTGNVISENSILSGNFGALSYSGIQLTDSNNNTISSNNIVSNFDDFFDNSYSGIHLWDSSDNIVIGNTLVKCGFQWYGLYQNILEGNTINGKPLVYLLGESDKVIDYAGQIILIQCDSITIENIEISNTQIAIELLETHNCIINGNTLTNNWRGVCLEYSDNNIISENMFSDNRYSVNLREDSSHIVVSNNIIQNSAIGISGSTGNNIIEENSIRNNGQGIYILGIFSNKNTISFNIISNNWRGIALTYSKRNAVSNNIIENNTNGLYLEDHANRNDIFSNTIKNNTNGVNLSNSDSNSIKRNNFIENDLHACFDTAFRNHWLRNYWEGDILPPARIDGMISFYKTDYWGNIIWELHIPWVNFDWLPALKPYDIGV